MESRSDEQLMSAVILGDGTALEVLVHRYHQPLLGYLYRLLGGQHLLAEDLVQETFIRLLKPGGYQSNRAFRPWLYTIATNLARDYLKSAANRHALFNAEELLYAYIDEAPGPEEYALAAEETRMISMAIGQLTEEYRSTLLLRFYSDLSLQEITEALHIPLGTVKSRLSVGIRRLRELLAANERGLKR